MKGGENMQEIQRLHTRLVGGGVVHAYTILDDKRIITVGDDVVVTQSKNDVNTGGYALALEMGEMKMSRLQTTEETLSCILFYMATRGV